MNRIINTLCPYTCKPLNTIPYNSEHVLLAGLGTPESFTVNASSEENTKINLLLDEPFLDDPMIKFISSSSGVSSRKGQIPRSFNAIAKGINEEVLVKIAPDNIDFKIKVPVKKDSNNKIIAVTGYSHEVNETLEKVKNKYKKKGVTVNTSKPISKETEVGIQLSLDMNLLNFQQLKTAYLSIIYVFGDIGINCIPGDAVRYSLLNKAPIRDKINGLSTLEWDHKRLPFLPETPKDRHTIACFNIGSFIICAVSLFGCMKKIIAFKSNELDAESSLGTIFSIDYQNRKMERIAFLEHFLKSMSKF